MAKKEKENAFESVLKKFSVNKEQPQYEVRPEVLNDLWAGVHAGSIYSIWGEKGCGKCMDGDMRVSTTKGFIKIKDLMKNAPNGYTKFEQEVFVMTPTGAKRANRFYKDTNAKVAIIKHSGHELIGTYNHPILAMNKVGILNMTTLGEITKDHLLAFKIKHGDIYINDNFKMAVKFIGYLMGLWQKSQIKKVDLTDGHERFYLQMSRNIFKHLKDANFLQAYHLDTNNCIIELIPSNFTTPLNSMQDPEYLFTCSEEVRRYFIHGVFLAVGKYVHKFAYKEEYATFEFTNKTLADYVSEVLFTLGVYHQKINKDERYILKVISAYFDNINRGLNIFDINNYNQEPLLNIDYIVRYRFIKCILTNEHTHNKYTPYHIEILSNDVITQSDIREICTFYKDVLPSDLKIYGDYYFVEIDSIQEGRRDVYDITVHDGHLFYAGGFLNHNTTLTIQVLRSLLKQGQKGVFVDIEKAFNTIQQETYGLKEFVDNGQLIVLTCSNWKEFEEIVMSVAGSGINFFAVDSVTMLRAYTPNEITVEDIRPGLRALQEGQVLGKMKDIFYHEGIAAFLLFHARANIQITGYANKYSPTTKQAGGYASEHVPDVITKIQTSTKIKNEDGDVIGQEINVVTEKNKFKAPFRVRKESLIFGKGIDARISLIERALQANVIQQTGAFYMLPNGDRVKGRKALYDLPNDTLRDIKNILASM